ncbi:MAG TPA: ABC transporter permease [Vicinamibacterales bacterium]|nr:ABC transporter permease [Vicinamibacterales bacterium]
MFAALVAAVLLIANIIADPNFGKPSNWPEQLAVLAPFALVAVASTPAIVSGGGGIDISVGPLAVVVNTMLVVWFLPTSGLDSAAVAIPLLLLFGTAVGAINGLLVTLGRFQAVIATLCTFFVLSGVAQAIAPTPRTANKTQWLESLGNQVGPIPGALILLAIPVGLWLILSRTSFHRTLYAVGGNDATAYSSGVDVTSTRIIAYALGGLFAATAGIALTALVMSSQASNVAGYTLVALAAVALGGTPLGGGRGGLTGSIMGALVIYELQSLLSAVGVASTWNQFVYGGMLIVGVIVGARLQVARASDTKAVTA